MVSSSEKHPRGRQLKGFVFSMARIVLVTGGSSGIGHAVARHFAREGSQVVITGRTEARLAAAAKELGPDVRGVVCDAADPAAVARLVAELPAVDVLVNAAGGLGRPAAGAESDAGPGAELERVAAQWRADLDANLFTAVLTTSAYRERLVPGSTVISIGSIGAERRGGSYGAAKAALAAWNAALSADLGPRGVTCNVISAGYIAGTQFFAGVGGVSPERHAALIAETHDKRAGSVEDIAATAFFLASPGARHITGQTIHVNGGAWTTR
jgi:3-oxoacyl-[acyl-carrier protein] reductase